MRILIWLLAVLLASLLQIAVADDEKSGIRHRVDALEQDVEAIGEWIMSQEGGGSGYQVYADNGEQVGEFLGMANPWNPKLAMVALEVDGIKLVLRVGVGGIWWDEILFYADEDCAGQAFMAENWFLDKWFGDRVLVSVIPGIHHARVPYVPQPGGIPGDPGVIRIGTPNGCEFFDGVPPLPLIPVDPLMRPDEPAPWDLSQDYPAPYHLDN